MAKISLDRFQLQFISHQNEKMSYLNGIREVLAGECKWIQLRMKGATDEEVRPIALKVKEWCKEQNATFLIDDRVQLVKELQVDGVHLGKNDMPIAEARKILGDDFIIGGTANTFEDVKAHYEAGADYIGCGPFRFTKTTNPPTSAAAGSPHQNDRRRVPRSVNPNSAFHEVDPLDLWEAQARIRPARISLLVNVSNGTSSSRASG